MNDPELLCSSKVLVFLGKTLHSLNEYQINLWLKFYSFGSGFTGLKTKKYEVETIALLIRNSYSWVVSPFFYFDD